MSEADGAERATLEAAPDRAPQSSARPKHWIRRFVDSVVDALLPAAIQGGAPRARNRSRMLAGLLLILVGISLAILVGRSNQGVPEVVGVAWILLGSFTLLVLAMRMGWLSLVATGHATLALMYIASMGIVVASGGEAVGAVMVASALPTVAYAIEGRRAAIGWSLAVLIGIGVTAIYAQTTTVFPYRDDMLAWEQWRFPTMVLAVGFVLLATLGIDWMLERADREMEEVQAQLQRQETRYRDLVENVGDCMMEYDSRFRCLYASPNWKELLGRTPETMLGRGYLSCLPRDDDDEINERNEALFARPGTTVKYRSRVQHVDGHWIEGEVSARSFYSRDGDLHMVTIFRDHSELQRAQLALRHSDRLASAGTLAAGIAHQINNPIGAIRNASEFALISADEGDIGQVQEALRNNIDQAARCGEIVRSLLQFAAQEHRDKTTRDLVPVVERACGFAEGFGGKHGVRVVVQATDAPVPVKISAIEIEQVIVNLVHNAILAEPRAHRVDVMIRAEDSEAVVEVRDDGCGISPTDLDRVFDPFFTTRLKDGGSGLGLSVALGIAQEHGGQLEVDSRLGEGSCVRLRLPLAETDSPRRRRSLAVRPTASASAPGG